MSADAVAADAEICAPVCGASVCGGSGGRAEGVDDGGAVAVDGGEGGMGFEAVLGFGAVGEAFEF